MNMCKVYVTASQKGGVAKTTTAGSLGIGLAKKGYKVLLVDADAQGSLTASLGYKEPDSMNDTLAVIMEKEIQDEEYDPNIFGILHHNEGVDLVPSNIELAAVEVALIQAMSRETILKRYIDKVKDNYDYIIIDSAPSLGLITINVLVAADRIIIPVQAAYLSVKGLEQLIKTISRVRRNLNNQLGIDGVLITMLDKRTVYAREIVELLDNAYGKAINIYNSRIPFSIRAVEATTKGVSIYKHDPKGKVAEAYSELTEEVLANA